MRYLADESCDYSVVRALRLAGHDVVQLPKYRRGKRTTMLESERRQRIAI
jgi:hypothetical protein